MNFFSKKHLHFKRQHAIITKLSDTDSDKENIRVWRSLVSRLNGVQEASSSNLDTRTTKTERAFALSVFIFFNDKFEPSNCSSPMDSCLSAAWRQQHINIDSLWESGIRMDVSASWWTRGDSLPDHPVVSMEPMPSSRHRSSPRWGDEFDCSNLPGKE